ncbi:MAG: SulP family inorganic anion transporter [Rikenellaceae bacterium]
MKSFFNLQPAIISATKNYSRDKFVSDILAGLIVSIVALPLAIAFGIASGVSPETGLITAIVGGFMVALLGGCSVQIAGPTGAFIVILHGIIENFGFEGLIVSTVMAGMILVILGVLKMGTVIKFIPYPIVVGFTSGIAITIFTSQVKDLLGLTVDNLPSEFVYKWGAYFSVFNTIDPYTFGVGLLTILTIIFTPKISKKIPGSLVALVLMTGLTFLLRNNFGVDSIETIGDKFTINAAFPTPRWINIDFKMINQLLPSAITIALLCAIESMLSAIVADGVTGDKHDSNMELVAQGAANIMSPFFGGIPVTGAAARTMTNISNGAKTPVAGVIHAIVLLLILVFLGPLTRLIPMACLAGVLAVVSYNMADWKTFGSLLKGSKSDVAVLLATFTLTIFFDLTIAIMVGLLMAMVLFMKRIANITKVSVAIDKLELDQEDDVAHDEEVLTISKGVEVYEIDGPFFFGVANKFDVVMGLLANAPKVRVIRMRKVPFMDTTGVHNLRMMIRSSHSEGIKIVLSGVRDDVRKTLQNFGFNQLIGEENICSNIHEALKVANKFVESKE